MKQYLEKFFEDPEKFGVLVAEDKHSIREVLKRQLKLLGFQNIFLAQNGWEALEIYHKRREEIFLIISDLQMPIMRGDEFFMQLVNNGGAPRFLLTSGSIQEWEIQRLKKAGLNGFIPKPFDCEQLKNAISLALM